MQHRNAVHPGETSSDEDSNEEDKDEDVIELYRANDTSISCFQRNSSDDFNCLSCSRAFSTFGAREQHRKAVHPDDKNHDCPFCSSRHVSASAVVQHLESGGCRSQASRQCVDEHIFRATTGTGSSFAGTLVPHNRQSFEPITFYQATEKAINSRGFYECYFCPGLEFHLLKQLNQHLESPKHSNRTESLYACPTCGSRVQTLSGLIQHAEMGSCGIRRDSRVQGALESMTSGMRQISF
ncbi:hypothetical protein QFC22_005679 [Naganishia vaughanmartiniae]|uniref:Uncharacterized protein n=1 Tax=Naganishia vaughanmartiniae TaxID=1424756 RepID=A0ACC2WUL4_9TREE|nr:hypothetical protein QFC22_005679 [Naganishia vaughanmartiniae]